MPCSEADPTLAGGACPGEGEKGRLATWQRVSQRKSQWLVCMLVKEENSDPLKPRDCRDTHRCSQQHRYPHPEYLPPPQNTAAPGPGRTGGKHPAHVAGEGASLSSSPSLLSSLSSLSILSPRAHSLRHSSSDHPQVCSSQISPWSRPAPELQVRMPLLSWAPLCPNSRTAQILPNLTHLLSPAHPTLVFLPHSRCQCRNF